MRRLDKNQRIFLNAGFSGRSELESNRLLLCCNDTLLRFLCHWREVGKYTFFFFVQLCSTRKIPCFLEISRLILYHSLFIYYNTITANTRTGTTVQSGLLCPFSIYTLVHPQSRILSKKYVLIFYQTTLCAPSNGASSHACRQYLLFQSCL